MADRFSAIVVEIAKVRDYCLDESHPRGRHKARIFRSILGLTVADAEYLRQVLLDTARDRQDDFLTGECDEFGQRYMLDFPLNTTKGSATIRSAWIVLTGENVLRLASSYVLLR